MLDALMFHAFSFYSLFILSCYFMHCEKRIIRNKIKILLYPRNSGPPIKTVLFPYELSILYTDNFSKLIFDMR